MAKKKSTEAEIETEEHVQEPMPEPVPFPKQPCAFCAGTGKVMSLTETYKMPKDWPENEPAWPKQEKCTECNGKGET